MDVTRKQVEKMMEDVDEDKSGEVELPEFEQIMTAQLAGADDKTDDGKGGGSAGVPFHVMATRYGCCSRLSQSKFCHDLSSSNSDVLLCC